MARGGIRKGSGRKKKYENLAKARLQIYAPPELHNKIRDFANNLKNNNNPKN